MKPLCMYTYSPVQMQGITNACYKRVCAFKLMRLRVQSNAFGHRIASRAHRISQKFSSCPNVTTMQYLCTLHNAPTAHMCTFAFDRVRTIIGPKELMSCTFVLLCTCVLLAYGHNSCIEVFSKNATVWFCICVQTHLSLRATAFTSCVNAFTSLCVLTLLWSKTHSLQCANAST